MKLFNRYRNRKQAKLEATAQANFVQSEANRTKVSTMDDIMFAITENINLLKSTLQTRNENIKREVAEIKKINETILTMSDALSMSADDTYELYDNTSTILNTPKKLDDILTYEQAEAVREENIELSND